MLALPLLTLLASCATYERMVHDGVRAGEQLGLRSSRQIERRGNWVLPQTARIQVSAGELPYSGTAPQPGVLLVEALRGRFARVTFDSEARGLELAQDQATVNGADYLLYPRLLLWQDAREHQAVEARSGARDENLVIPLLDRLGHSHTALLITVVDLRAGSVVDTVRIAAGDGKLVLYGPGAERLLQESIVAYVNGLAGELR